MIKVHKIIDPQSSSPLSTILETEHVYIMIDCGLSMTSDLTPYKIHHDLLTKIDLVIVTGSEIGNCGALLYLINTFNYHVNLSEQNIHDFTYEVSP